MARPRKNIPNQPPPPSWAQRLVDARTARGLTQAALAEAFGQSQSVVSDYERGRSEPNLDGWRRLGAELGVSPAWLAFGAGGSEPHDGDAHAMRIADVHKQDRHFSRALLAVARMLADEGLDADALLTVQLATRIAQAAQDATDNLEARDQIDRAIEAERLEIRQGLDALIKNRVRR